MTALLVTAPAARAQDVTRLPLGSTIRVVVPAPDGGAWISYAPVCGRDRLGRVAQFGERLGGERAGRAG